MKLYHNPDWLRQKYHVEELSTRQMAKKAGCSQHVTIRYWMKKFGIPIRSQDSAMKLSGRQSRIPLDIKLLRQLYVEEGKSISKIAAEFGVCYTIVQKRMVESGISRRTISKATSMAISNLDPGKEWLFQSYWIDGRSTYDMAEEKGCAKSTITKWMDHYNIPRRDIAENHALGLYDGVYQSPTKPEYHIMEVLDNMGIDYEFQFRLGSYHYDFRLTALPILIEFDGHFWHHSEWAHNQGRQESDACKTELAKENGYCLLRFTEADIDGNHLEIKLRDAIIGWVEGLGLRQHVEIPEIHLHVEGEGA